jgi:twitching motility two-component system response regulator PilG
VTDPVLGKHVLVVDDDEPINELVRIVLETRGYQVVSAADGTSALDAVARLRPDLVVLDVMMPGVDGFEVCRRIKEDPATKDTKVVMLSAKSLDVDRHRAEAVGADLYLTKPVKLADLLDAVNALLFVEGAE